MNPSSIKTTFTNGINSIGSGMKRGVSYIVSGASGLLSKITSVFLSYREPIIVSDPCSQTENNSSQTANDTKEDIFPPFSNRRGICKAWTSKIDDAVFPMDHEGIARTLEARAQLKSDVDNRADHPIVAALDQKFFLKKEFKHVPIDQVTEEHVKPMSQYVFDQLSNKKISSDQFPSSDIDQEVESYKPILGDMKKLDPNRKKKTTPLAQNDSTRASNDSVDLS